MNKYEVTAVESGSTYGVVYKPTYKSFSAGIGTFVVATLSQFKTGSGICIQRLAGGYTVRRLTAADLTTQRAQAITDLGNSDLTKITGVVSSGVRFDWTFDDDITTYADPVAKDIGSLLNALLDGDLTADLVTATITHTAIATNDWIFIDSDDGKIYYGPGSVTFGTNITTPLPDPEVTLSPVVGTWTL